MTLGISSLPPVRASSRRQSSTDTWDYYYPGIQVIQPTPKTSPCPSERSSNRGHQSISPAESSSSKQPPVAQIKYRAKSLSIEEQQRQDSIDTISIYSSDDKLPTATASRTSRKMSTSSAVELTPSAFDLSHSSAQQLVTRATSHSQPNIIRKAPLASLSSLKISSMDYQDSDLKSLGSDSVFAESYADTDDEMDQFSLDSDETISSNAQSPPTTRSHSQQPQQQSSDTLRRQSLMGGKPGGISSKSSTMETCTSSSSRQPLTIGLANICSTVNECELKVSRGRTILQRSSTIYPSSESLTKVQYHLPNSQQTANVENKAFNTFETMATIERTSPSAASTGSSSTSAISSASVIPQHLYSTPPTTRKSNTPPAQPARPARSSTARPASYAGSTGFNPPRLSNVFSSSQRSNNIPMDALPLDRSEQPGQQLQLRPASNTNPPKTVANDLDLTTFVAGRPSPNPNPSVIIELPVISVVIPSTGNDDADGYVDPSLPPGTSRKWSKETLF